MIDSKALRERIIDMAVSGKLNKHTEKSASEELKSIISALGNSKQRDISDAEKWTDIPSNWTWACLADLTTTDTLNDGNWVLSEDMVPDGDVKLIQLGSIGDCEYRYKGFKYLTEKHFIELNGRQIYPGYLLINRLVVDKMLSCIVPDIKGILMTAVDVCWVAPSDDFYSIEYLMYAMASTGIQQRVQELGHGVTRFRISKLNLIDIAFPMPPIEEQRSIVNTINELYGILNQIDSLQAKYCKDLSALKSKIIDAGIQGKLTEQLPEDGVADELIERIADEKAKLIKSGKIPKEKKLPKISDDDKPFDIPHNWRWVRVQDVASYITDYVANGSFATLKAHTKTYREPNYAIFVRTMDFGTNFKEGCSYIDKESYDFLEKSRLFGGELILPNIGASIGKAFIMPDLGIPMSLAPNSILLKFTEPIMNEYFSFVIKSTYGAMLLNKTQGGSATAKFSKTDLRTLVVPLPPLEEIKRIVDTLNSLSLIIEQVYQRK